MVHNNLTIKLCELISKVAGTELLSDRPHWPQEWHLVMDELNYSDL